MLGKSRYICVLIVVVTATTFIGKTVWAQPSPQGQTGTSSSLGAGDTQTSIFDTAKPWPGLRRVDADLAVRILRGQPGLMHRLADGSKTIFWVKSATIRLVPGSPTQSLKPGFLAYGPLDPSRWDLILNGQVVDPREFEILYDERIFNLGALFTYGAFFDPESQLAPWEETEP